MNDGRMSLTEHLQELRTRLQLVIGLVLVFFIAGYFLSRPVLYWLIRRSPIHHLAVIGVTEAFFGLITVDFVLSMVAASPFLLYEVEAYVFPALTPTEKKMTAFFTVPGFLLFLLGWSAGFFWFVPIVLRVMLTFTGHGIVPVWTLANYLSFVIDLSLPFGILAELPLISGILSRFGILHPTLFAKYRRYAILLAFLISAILAPPDALSMTLMALPIYLIYELAYVISRMTYQEPRDERSIRQTIGRDQ